MDAGVFLDFGQAKIQIVNFMLYGLLTLCFAAGLRRVLRTGASSLRGPILFFIVGLGRIAIGPFVTDPVPGYPTATPAIASLGGSIHNLTSLTIFIALPAACFVPVRRFARDKWRGWASYSVATGALAVVFFMLFFASVSAANSQDSGGPRQPGCPSGYPPSSSVSGRVFSRSGS